MFEIFLSHQYLSILINICVRVWRGRFQSPGIILSIVGPATSITILLHYTNKNFALDKS